LIFGEWRSLSHNAPDMRYDLGFHVLMSKIIDLTSITRSPRRLLGAHEPHLQVGYIGSPSFGHQSSRYLLILLQDRAFAAHLILDVPFRFRSGNAARNYAVLGFFGNALSFRWRSFPEPAHCR
jgi:hypothetical protein